jgi:4-hydroxy-tetrahydrodipicolinate reductase
MIKVILHGCNGKMGQILTELLEKDSDMQVVAGISAHRNCSNSYPVFSRVRSFEGDADVVIDFSNAEAVDMLLEDCVAKKLPIVLCTTGLSEEQKKKVEDASKQIAILQSANMSLGVNLLLHLLQDAAKVLAHAGFDIELVERHHNQKVDAPSGTVLALADAINESLDNRYSYVFDRSRVRQKRQENEIGISAIRGGTIVGEHDIIFAGVDEVVEVKHAAYSRQVFGKGAMVAAKFLVGKKAGKYEMKDAIQL